MRAQSRRPETKLIARGADGPDRRCRALVCADRSCLDVSLKWHRAGVELGV